MFRGRHIVGEPLEGCYNSYNDSTRLAEEAQSTDQAAKLRDRMKHGASHRLCSSHVQRQEKSLREAIEAWKTAAIREISSGHEFAATAASELAAGLQQSSRSLGLKALGCLMYDAM